jgi:hypothetical protein
LAAVTPAYPPPMTTTRIVEDILSPSVPWARCRRARGSVRHDDEAGSPDVTVRVKFDDRGDVRAVAA